MRGLHNNILSSLHVLLLPLGDQIRSNLEKHFLQKLYYLPPDLIFVLFFFLELESLLWTIFLFPSYANYDADGKCWKMVLGRLHWCL